MITVPPSLKSRMEKAKLQRLKITKISSKLRRYMYTQLEPLFYGLFVGLFFDLEFEMVL